MKKNKKVKIGEFKEGTVGLGPEELDPQNTKVRITMFVDYGHYRCLRRNIRKEQADSLADSGFDFRVKGPTIYQIDLKVIYRVKYR